MTDKAPSKPAADGITPSPEQLQQAFGRIRRPHWVPTTLDDALEHPIYGPCIRALAKSIARAALAPSLKTQHARNEAPTLPARPPRREPTTTSKAPKVKAFDPRRAAANDRDDD